MKKKYIKTRNKWRNWLTKNHDKVPDGIWLVYYKKETNLATLEYDESVVEALCFGWIDSIIKKLDDERYMRKFTPRKLDSRWSALNKKRVAKAIREGIMTQYGLVKIEAAKKAGIWDQDNRPQICFDVPDELKTEFEKNAKAKDFFGQLAPTYQKHFIGWIQIAKRDETRKKRIEEAISLLEQGKKLGLK